jgi:tight adherence protein B
MELVLVALVGLTVAALLLGLFKTSVFMADKRREALVRRLQAQDGDLTAERVTLLRRRKLARSAWLSDLVSLLPKADGLERIVQQAQVPITVAQLFSYSLFLSLLTGTVGWVLGEALVGLVFGGVAFASPTLVILAKRSQRSRKISEQLPDALDMMSRSLRAGHALASTFQLVAREMPEPISDEFGLAFEEQNLGASFDRAVMQMAKRAPHNGDLKIFAVSVIIQKETGGNLVEVLEKISETIRARYRFYGKLQALTAESKLSGVILGVLPIATGILVSIVNPEYLQPLFTTTMGKTFMIYAVVMWLGGGLWLRHMAKVDL